MTRHLIAPLLLLTTLTYLAASQEAPQRALVGQSVMASQISTKVAPVYPPLARQARIQGAVVLKVRISKTGDVQNIQLISGHPMLAPSAIEAVKQWKYKPYLVNGDPVEVETNVSVNFSLAGKAAGEGAAGDAVRGIAASEPASGETAHTALPQRIRVSPGVMQGLLISKVQPEYPADARDQRIQGAVVLAVKVDREGTVANIQLVSGDPLLAPAAIEAVKQWKYRPYLLNGAPLEVETQVIVNFTLAE
jgi:TonB family protein